MKKRNIWEQKVLHTLRNYFSFGNPNSDSMCVYVCVCVTLDNWRLSGKNYLEIHHYLLSYCDVLLNNKCKCSRICRNVFNINIIQQLNNKSLINITWALRKVNSGVKGEEDLLDRVFTFIISTCRQLASGLTSLIQMFWEITSINLCHNKQEGGQEVCITFHLGR